MNNLATMPEYNHVLLKHRAYLQHWIEVSGDMQAKLFAVRAK